MHTNSRSPEPAPVVHAAKSIYCGNLAACGASPADDHDAPVADVAGEVTCPACRALMVAALRADPSHTSECRAYSPEHGAECLLRVGHDGPHANGTAGWEAAPDPMTAFGIVAALFAWWEENSYASGPHASTLYDGDLTWEDAVLYVTRHPHGRDSRLYAAAPALRDALAAIVACYPRVREESSPIEHARALLATLPGGSTDGR